MSSAAFLCAPYEPIPSKYDPTQRVAYLRWQKKLGDVIHYQSGYREIPVDPGCVAYACNRGKIDDFHLGEYPGDSLAKFVALCESYPGEYLATWTYGHAVHVVFLASRAERPMREVSVRLACPPGGRNSHLVEGFLKWFTGAVIKPDLEQLREQFSRPEISVKCWFAAFGIEGANDLASDSGEIWKDFERAALTLLAGDHVEDDLIGRVNARIPDDDSHLTEELGDQPGVTARLVHSAAFELAETFGEPKIPAWQARYRAARFYWDITDCEDSCERLTVGIDEQGLGTSASLGRLLAHYPVELMRDPIFLAFAGMEAEGANGHAFVEAFHCLAEAAQRAGFSVAVFPEMLESKFRKAFGMESEWEAPRSARAQGWAAEAFVDLPGLLTVDTMPVIEHWYAAEQADGLLVRGEPDGSFRVAAFRGGEKVDMTMAGFAEPDHERLFQAARQLHPRGVFPALGLPDLLEPGEWHEGAYSGEAQDRTAEFDEVTRLLSDLPEPTPIGSFKELLGPFPREIRSHRSRVQGREQPLAMSIVIPGSDDRYRDLLMDDLGCSGLLATYGQSLPEGSDTIRSFSYSDLTTGLLIRVLGDVPDGTSIAWDLGRGRKFHYRLDRGRATDEMLFRACVSPRSGEPEWEENPLEGIQVDHPAVQDIVLEKGDRIYFRLDLTKMSTVQVRESEEIVGSLKNLGFVHLGDLFCDEFNMVVVRACAREDRQTLGAVLVPKSGSPTIPCYAELSSSFEDGSSLTTTTLPNAKDKPARKKHVQIVPVVKGRKTDESSANELWQTHLAGIERFRLAGTLPRPVDPSLLGMALALEDAVEVDRASWDSAADAWDDADDDDDDDDEKNEKSE
ncbi:MAG: hypothetical protein AB1646_13760 [Thermodesulfobacteriota bacterium]